MARASLPEVRHRRQEPLGVGVRRRREQLRDRRLLDDLTAVHDDDAVREIGDDTHVVRDQDDRGPEAVAQPAEQVEDRGLHGDVESGGGLVGNDELGLAGDRDRDHHALLLATGHLVRVRVDPALRVGDADEVEQLDRASVRGAAGHPSVRAERLHDLPADGADRVERGRGLLEDHRDPVAAHPAHRLAAESGELDAVHPGGAADGRRAR
ncbi:hypothetical protein GALL_391350 [mine drainage metagenome]|uniref:Uncharacterized protein n=1 Tax=mine drainage metagenome TaxID=410659 RepID=A0A1J5Q7G4_9ZZZZ